MKNAVQTLLSGGVVAFPTETVFALGGDSQNKEAIEKIYALKNRPKNKALSLLIADFKALNLFTENIPPKVFPLLQNFWPGPLTCIFPKSSYVLKEVLGEENAIALRMPAHSVALSLIQNFSREKGKLCALAAPSANLSGHFSPTLPLHVQNDFGKAFPVLSGVCALGTESTLLDCTTSIFKIKRRGAILLNDLQKVAPDVEFLNEEKPFKNKNITLPCYLMDGAEIDHFLKENPRQKVAVLGFKAFPKAFYSVEMANDPELYAQNIYAFLHQAEEQKSTCILLESPPQNEEWQSVWNFFHGQLKNILKIFLKAQR